MGWRCARESGRWRRSGCRNPCPAGYRPCRRRRPQPRAVLGARADDRTRQAGLPDRLAGRWIEGLDRTQIRGARWWWGHPRPGSVPSRPISPPRCIHGWRHLPLSGPARLDRRRGRLGLRRVIAVLVARPHHGGRHPTDVSGKDRGGAAEVAVTTSLSGWHLPRVEQVQAGASQTYDRLVMERAWWTRSSCSRRTPVRFPVRSGRGDNGAVGKCRHAGPDVPAHVRRRHRVPGPRLGTGLLIEGPDPTLTTGRSHHEATPTYTLPLATG